MRLLAISGSLRAGSYNTALARAAVDLAPAGVDVEVFDGLGDLPLFDADLEGDAHEAVQRLRDEIGAADAVREKEGEPAEDGVPFQPPPA